MEDRSDDDAVPFRRVSFGCDRSLRPFRAVRPTSHRESLPFVTVRSKCACDACSPANAKTRNIHLPGVNPRSFAWGRCVRGNMADRTAKVQMLRCVARCSCALARRASLVCLRCAIAVSGISGSQVPDCYYLSRRIMLLWLLFGIGLRIYTCIYKC